MNQDANRHVSEGRRDRLAPVSTALLVLAALAGGVLLGRLGPHQAATAQGAPQAAAVAAPAAEPGPAPGDADPGCGNAEACLVKAP